MLTVVIFAIIAIILGFLGFAILSPMLGMRALTESDVFYLLYAHRLHLIIAQVTARLLRELYPTPMPGEDFIALQHLTGAIG